MLFNRALIHNVFFYFILFFLYNQIENNRKNPFFQIMAPFVCIANSFDQIRPDQTLPQCVRMLLNIFGLKYISFLTE